MRPMLHLCVLAVLASGCGADFGALGGMATAHDVHAVAAGRLAVSTKLGTPANDHGILLGMEFESRAEAQAGASWNTGVMLGVGSGPAALDGRLGLEAFAEFGTPVRQTFFPYGDLYTGLAMAMPIHLGSPRHVVDMNESTWLLMERVELVPLVRVRVFRHNEPGHDVAWQPELAGGLALRVRLFSDLL